MRVDGIAKPLTRGAIGRGFFERGIRSPVFGADYSRWRLRALGASSGTLSVMHLCMLSTGEDPDTGVWYFTVWCESCPGWWPEHTLDRTLAERWVSQHKLHPEDLPLHMTYPPNKPVPLNLTR
jgi:hypothetical protein